MTEPSEKCDHFLVRLAKAASIIFIAAILSGLLYGYADYWRRFTSDTQLKRELAEERLEKDSLPAANRRFVIGAALGTLLGSAYVFRCVLRRKEL